MVRKNMMKRWNPRGRATGRGANRRTDDNMVNADSSVRPRAAKKSLEVEPAVEQEVGQEVEQEPLLEFTEVEVKKYLNIATYAMKEGTWTDWGADATNPCQLDTLQNQMIRPGHTDMRDLCWYVTGKLTGQSYTKANEKNLLNRAISTVSEDITEMENAVRQRSGMALDTDLFNANEKLENCLASDEFSVGDKTCANVARKLRVTATGMYDKLYEEAETMYTMKEQLAWLNARKALLEDGKSFTRKKVLKKMFEDIKEVAYDESFKGREKDAYVESYTGTASSRSLWTRTSNNISEFQESFCATVDGRREMRLCDFDNMKTEIFGIGSSEKLSDIADLFVQV